VFHYRKTVKQIIACVPFDVTLMYEVSISTVFAIEVSYTAIPDLSRCIILDFAVR
jgi:hypothetical protein